MSNNINSSSFREFSMLHYVLTEHWPNFGCMSDFLGKSGNPLATPSLLYIYVSVTLYRFMCHQISVSCVTSDNFITHYLPY